jgi:hypothetical protein
MNFESNTREVLPEDSTTLDWKHRLKLYDGDQRLPGKARAYSSPISNRDDDEGTRIVEGAT